MSFSKSWIVKSIRRRLGWTIVIAGAALATTLAMGNSVVAAVVAIGIVIAVSALISSRGEPTSDEEDLSARARNKPFALSHRWQIDQQPDLEEISQALGHEPFALTQESRSTSQIVLRGGSQFRMRLFGGYFVNPKRLPIQVELNTTDAVNGGRVVELGVRDSFGIAVRDEALEDRFTQAAEGIQRAVGDRLEAMGVLAVDSGSTPPH